MNPFIQSLGLVFGPVVGSIFVSGAVATAAYAYQLLLQRLPANVRSQVEAIAQMAVQAIEQRYSDAAQPTGRQKKMDALSTINDIAGALKIPVDVTHASAAIEAAVFQMNQQKQAQTAAQP